MVLAGGLQIAPALNLAICWNNSEAIILHLSQSAENLESYKVLGILRDYTPDLCIFKISSADPLIDALHIIISFSFLTDRITMCCTLLLRIDVELI